MTNIVECIFQQLQEINKELDLFGTDKNQLIHSMFVNRYMIWLQHFGAMLWTVLVQLGETAELVNTDISGMVERWKSNVFGVEREIQRIGQHTLLKHQREKTANLHHQVFAFRQQLTTMGTQLDHVVVVDWYPFVALNSEIRHPDDEGSLQICLDKLVLVDQIQADISIKIIACNIIIQKRNIAVSKINTQKDRLVVKVRAQSTLKQELISLNHSTALLVHTGPMIIRDIYETLVKVTHNSLLCSDSIQQISKQIMLLTQEITRICREIKSCVMLEQQLLM